MLTRVSTGLAVVLFISLFLCRSFAQQFDFSVANILTLVLGFFAWLALVVGLISSRLPRFFWVSAALIPFLAIGLTLMFYRVARVDGELVPQLEWRWKKAAELPKMATAADSPEHKPLDARLYASRSTDFPQFLGPNRNATLSGVRLEADWEAHPPELLWKKPIGEGWAGFAIQGDVAVTLEQRDEEQWISAYLVVTGRMLWHAAVAGNHFNPLGGRGPRSTPTIADDRVYVHLDSGKVACFNLSDGSRVWEVDLFELTGWDQATAETKVSWGRAGSPLVTDGMVIVPLGGPKPESGSLIALSATDGQIVWRGGSEQISYSSPMRATLLGVDQVLIVNEASVTGHELASGKELWKVPWPGQSNGSASVSQPIPLDDSRVLLCKGYSQGAEVFQLSLDEDGHWSFEVLWRNASVLKTKFTNAVVHGDFAYGLSDGILECVDTQTGHSAWKRGRYRQGQLLLVEDKLLITSESGAVVLVAADPAKYRELAKLDVLGDVSWNTPALSGNRLLIRNADEAACLRLPLEP